jgi:hypothetical protein
MRHCLLPLATGKLVQVLQFFLHRKHKVDNVRSAARAKPPAVTSSGATNQSALPSHEPYAKPFACRCRSSVARCFGRESSLWGHLLGKVNKAQSEVRNHLTHTWSDEVAARVTRTGLLSRANTVTKVFEKVTTVETPARVISA